MDLIKKTIVIALSLAVIIPTIALAQVFTTHQGGTGLVNVAAGSIPFGSVFNLRLATSSAFQFNNSASRLSVTYASTTGVTASKFFGSLVGNADTATALSSMNISQFTNNSGYLTAITADSPLSGSGTSASHLTINTSGTWSGNAGTATALAANGTNCSAGNAPLGVDASGNSENCFSVATFAYPFPAGATTTLVTFTNATSTLFSSTYASSTNYFGANLSSCIGTNALTWSGGFFGCQAQPQGTVTSVTASYPLSSSGGPTPNIATAFGTTSPWGIGNNGFYIAGATGVPFVAASSTLNLPNSALANSTISGVALGGTLAALTATDASLTFSGSYTGTTARTVGLNVGNANVWTALQTFGNASTSLFSVTNKAYFGGIATTTIDSTGNIVIPSGSGLTITGKSDGCATFATGVLNSTGVACSSGGSAYPFTPSTFGIAVSATSTPLYPSGLITGTSTIGALVASSSITNQSVKSALVLNGSGGLEGAYGGASACSSNNWVTTISAVGGTTCGTIGANSVTLSMFPTIAANTVIGNLTGGTATPTALATSTLFAGTTGQSAYFSASGLIGTSSLFTATNQFVGIATTTPVWPFTVYANSTPQFALSAGAGLAQWFFANEGGNFYLGTTTAAGTATSTFASSMTILGTGAASVSIGSTTQTVSAVNGLFTQGTNGTSGSSTLSAGKWQADIYNTAGTRSCMFVVGTTLTVVAGACTP